MYDWKGRYIEYDEPNDRLLPLRDGKGHFLPHQATGIRVYTFQDATYFDEAWGCDRTISVPVYRNIPVGEPIPDGWQWDQEYYTCRQCGDVFAKEE